MGLRIDQNEKRDFIRMQVDTHATLNTGSNQYDVRCIDLSSTGARLSSSEPLYLNEGETATLTIDSGGGYTAPLEADVEIVRTAEEAGKSVVAVKIKHIR